MSDPGFEALLEFLERSRGFDFTGYNRAGLERRFRRRMELVDCTSFGDYLDFLEVHPDEFEKLFNTLLINVTGFFRDKEAWQLVETDVIPRTLSQKEPEAPLRVWSAGWGGR